jgi:hypothetical protein
MGFFDKAKENIERVAKQGQGKIDEVQSKKKADGLLRDLGAWTYAAHTGRDDGKGPTEMQRICSELEAHEAEHGPLGGDKHEAEGESGEMSSAPPPAATSPPAMSPPPMSPPPMSPPAPMSPTGPPPGAPPAPPPGGVQPSSAEPTALGGESTVDDL